MCIFTFRFRIPANRENPTRLGGGVLRRGEKSLASPALPNSIKNRRLSAIAAL
jgi:hypothetical protein